VLSIDEKTGIQAKSRKHPMQGVQPGQPERREFDSRDDLVARMLAFIEHRNQTAQPFNRVYDAKKAA
jgi:hypothetical protein